MCQLSLRALTTSLLSHKPKHHSRTKTGCNLPREHHVGLASRLIGAGGNGSGWAAGAPTSYLHASLHSFQLQGGNEALQAIGRAQAKQMLAT